MTRSPASDNTRAWHFLVLRSQNFRSLRSEKVWRPIVTIDIDEHHSHEVVLGVDGQNPNLKQPLILEQVHEGSRVEFKVWHKSQSHKARNRRKRHLVASASSSLGEIAKRQGDEPHIDVRLSTTTNQTRKNGSSKQNPHACLLVRLRAPSSSTRIHVEDYDDHANGQYSDGAMSDDAPSSSVATPTSEHSEERRPWDQCTDQSTLVDDRPTKLRRRRPKPKGYCLDSDDEAATEYSSTDDDCEREGSSDNNGKPLDLDLDPWPSECADDETSSVTVEVCRDTRHPRPPLGIALPSFLPMSYIPDNASIASSVSAGRSVFDLFTYYRELREARVDSDFERVLGRLIAEWYYVGASLLAVAALDTAVFGFSPDAMFSVDSVGKRCVTLSAIACAIGLAMDAWFIFAYTGADVQKFQTLAVDVYSSFFFFALTSRLPLLALLAGVLTLVLFLLLIAWDAWPTAVLVMSCAAGVLFTLQFIVYGFHRAALVLAWVLRGVYRAGVRGVGRVRGRGRGPVVQMPVPVPQASAAVPSGSSVPPLPRLHSVSRSVEVRVEEVRDVDVDVVEARSEASSVYSDDDSCK